ncbi:MAG: transcriptional regulator [Solirubrobacterales bacterium]|nr:transcriptional regulator [Solirubrobacterales bacterium]
MSPADPASAQDQLPSLDPVIHAQHRLRVMVVLAALEPQDRITFPRLREHVGMTAGNLSTHVRKLEDAGYVRVTKTHRRRTPVTYLALTATGRDALDAYTEKLHQLLETSNRHDIAKESRREQPTRPDARRADRTGRAPRTPAPRPTGAG